MRLTQLNTGLYSITWKSSTQNGLKTGVNRTLTTINGLTSSTAYNVTVTAQNSAGVSQPSDPVTLATGLLTKH